MKKKATKKPTKQTETAVTLRQIVDAWPVLARLYEQPVSGELAFRLARFIKAIEPDYVAQEDTRQKLVKQYGEEVEIKGQKMVQVPGDKYEAFQQEYGAVLDTAVSVPEFSLSLTDIERFGDVSARDMVAIEWFIQGDE